MRLIDRFWPGPLTLVLPKASEVPDLATSGLSTVALRMPKHSVAQALIAAAGTPLAAPSANRFGRISPTTAQAVADELGDRIDWIIDGGPCDVGVESTVLAIAKDGELTLLRPGGISLSEIEGTAGTAVLMGTGVASAGGQISPGLLESHYAPSAPLRLLGGDRFRGVLSNLPTIGAHDRVGVLLMCGPFEERRVRVLEDLNLSQNQAEFRCLSESGDPREMARGLFQAMRELDQSGVRVILAEEISNARGLGYAVMDRLRRAGIRG